MKRSIEGRIFRRRSRLTGAVLPTWHMVYYVNGEKRRQSTDTTDEAEAKRILGVTVGQVAEGKIKPRVVEHLTVADLLARLALHYADEGVLVPAGHVEAWRAEVGTVRAKDLERDQLDAVLRRWRARGIERVWSEPAGAAVPRRRARVRPLTIATCNRYVSTLRRAFAIAQEKVKGFDYMLRWPHFTETARGKRVREGDLPKLLAALEGPLADMARLAHDLGPRKGQWRKLQKRNVELDQAGTVVAIDWTPDQTKAELKHVIAVEPGTDSHAILQRLWDGRHVACPYLFHGDPCLVDARRKRPEGAGEPAACVGSLRSAWKAACKRAGLPVGRQHGGYTFKDLRNSFVSDMVDAGQDAAVIASFTGWANLSMLKRYTTVAQGTQRAAIARKNALRPAVAPEARVRPMRGKR